jgi:putative restriction endonuclease
MVVSKNRLEKGRRWTEEETRLSLFLYFQLTFGQLDKNNPEIRALAARIERTPSSVAMKLCNFASLDPKILSSGRKGLSGASKLDRAIWADFAQDWTSQVIQIGELFEPVDDYDGSKLRDVRQTYNYEPFVGPSTKTALVERRIGQDFFRRAVLANFENRCCITGIAVPKLLNASHILPWRDNVQQRHNPENGLALSATFDRAFDAGLIAFDEKKRLMIGAEISYSNDKLTQNYFARYEGSAMLESSRFEPSAEFLSWHRENRFSSHAC